jgi:hypothetical protein
MPSKRAAADERGCRGAPPLNPDASEADRVQIDLARPQGDAYDRALGHTVNRVAHGGTAGDGRFVPAAGVTATLSAVMDPSDMSMTTKAEPRRGAA